MSRDPEAQKEWYAVEYCRLWVPAIIVPEADSIYVGGPMRGHDLFNFPAFDAAAARLREWGWSVYSPAEHDRAIGFDPNTGLADQEYSLEGAFRWDIGIIAAVAAIYLLEGWQDSQGAQLEHRAADMCGLKIYFEADGYVVRP